MSKFVADCLVEKCNPGRSPTGRMWPKGVILHMYGRTGKATILEAHVQRVASRLRLRR